MKTLILILIAITCLLPAASLFAATNYSMIGLGTFGGTESQSYDINNSGQVVGRAQTSSGLWHAFLWDNGSMTDLGTLPGYNESWAYGINDKGQVVGWSNNGTQQRAFLWENGSMYDLGALPGQNESMAFAINNSGQVLGNSDYPNPVIWESGSINALTVLSHYDHDITDINDSGQVVGGIVIGSVWDGGDAFVYENDTFTLLDRLDSYYSSTGYGINNLGQIVGQVGNSSGSMVAVSWENGIPTALGNLPGTDYSIALDINDSGQIVGHSGSYSATLWDDGAIIDLGNLPGESWSVATAINDNGWIAGHSGDKAVLWIPEPSSILLLSSFIVLLTMRRK